MKKNNIIINYNYKKSNFIEIFRPDISINEVIANYAIKLNKKKSEIMLQIYNEIFDKNYGPPIKDLITFLKKYNNI